MPALLLSTLQYSYSTPRHSVCDGAATIMKSYSTGILPAKPQKMPELINPQLIGRDRKNIHMVDVIVLPTMSGSGLAPPDALGQVP